MWPVRKAAVQERLSHSGFYLVFRLTIWSAVTCAQRSHFWHKSATGKLS